MAMHRHIPDSELKLMFSTASGPGGQNVNKAATKVQLKWRPSTSSAFSDKEKEIIVERLSHYLTDDGDILLSARSERTQSQNRDDVITRLERLVTAALTPRRKRVPTKPTRSSKERRLAQKKQHGQKKSLRKSPIE